jgi:hypothetical protein
MLLTKNFSKVELQCPCCGLCEIDNTLLFCLQLLRDDCGFPLIINSGCRCDDYNREVGGVEHSYHKPVKENGVWVRKTCAVDIGWHKYSASRKFDLYRLALKNRFLGIGVYKEFIHIDVRRSKALWVG